MVVHDLAVVTVEVVEPTKRPVTIRYDGQKIDPFDVETVFTISRGVHQLASIGYLPDHDFTRRMIGKVIR